MPMSADCSVAWAKEVTYGTFVAPTRATEFLTESLGWEKQVNQGQGMRVGSIVDRASRRAMTSASGAGDLDMNLASRGLGVLWENLLGSSVSTVVSGATYQQLHKVVSSQGSLSVQKGIYNAGTDAIDAFSFSGGLVKSVEIASPNGEDIKVKWTFDFRDLSTAAAYTAVTGLYPAATADEAYGFRHAALSVGGTLTAPTTTALATSTGAVSGCLRSFNLKIERDLTENGFCFGQGGRKSKPSTKRVNISGSFTALYDTVQYRNAFLADTAMPMLFNVTGDQALSTGFTGFQVALPHTRLEGAVPTSNEGDEITVQHDFKALHDTSTEPLWVVVRTADTAL